MSGESGGDGLRDADIGGRIRAEREQRGLSLRKLAARVEVSPSALSQIETGRSRPSVRTLYAIVSELGMSLDELFASEKGRLGGETSDRARPKSSRTAASEVVLRAGDRPRIDLESGVSWQRLNPAGDHGAELLEVSYDIGGSSGGTGTPVRHEGREYGLILSGCLRVTVGFEAYEIGPGDSICFESATPHRLETVGEEPVKAIWFVLDPREPQTGGPGGTLDSQWSPL